jgi:hypothetical protein
MKEIMRLFTLIALMRRGPQDLPASTLLLALAVGGYVAVNFLLCSALLTDLRWQGTLLLETLFMLLWYVVLLKLVGRPERTLQTTTAVFGLWAVLSPLLVATDWLVLHVGADMLWQIPVHCAGLLLLAWLIAASSQVVKAALEWSRAASVALVILQLVAGWVVVSAVFPAAKV